MLESIFEFPSRTIPYTPLTTTNDQAPATLTALLERINAARPDAPSAMLHTTAAHLARYIGAPVTELRLDTFAITTMTERISGWISKRRVVVRQR